MLKTEAQLDAMIAALLRKAELIDAQEDARHGGCRRPLSTPHPLSSVDPLAMPSRNLPTTAAGDPKGNAQRNFTDPDSRILKVETAGFRATSAKSRSMATTRSSRRWGLATMQVMFPISRPCSSGSWPTPLNCPRS